MDLDRLKALIDLVSNSSITELQITEGEESVRILREPGAAPAAAGQAPPAPAPAPASVAAPPPPAAAVPAPAPTSGHVVSAPLFGIFHRTAAPGTPPFVELGQTVEAGQKLAIIEAMKVFNTIAADAAGTVAEILAEAGQEVEPGQPLFRLA
jgi:acetyl-CoA carboxylase biotin carboxyl carrier protein